MHKGNQKRFGYSINVSKPFNNISGSHSSPILSFKGEYIDITINGFPRYPCYCQDKYHARNIINGHHNDSVNNGFPIWLLYRKVEIRLNKDNT